MATFPRTLLVLLLSVAAQAAPTFTRLYSFTGQNGDGANPFAGGTIFKGVLYGTTYIGGLSGVGTVFAMTPPTGGGAWTESVIHSFSGSDGAYPYGTLIADANGVLYGTTTYGGSAGSGTAFLLTPPPSPGGAWTETVLHSFTGADGAYPFAGLTLGTNGILYGTTELGGASGAGTVFALTPPTGGGAWTETVLYNFTDAADGGFPYGGLLRGSSGVLYGTTNFGGASIYGTVFKLTPPVAGGAWTLTTIYSFKGNGDGGNPFDALLMDSHSNLYGTSSGGIGSGWGTVFQLTPKTGSTWTETVLYRFSGGADGGHPRGALSMNAAGVLYGTTPAGGRATGYSGFGTIYQLTPPASTGPWTFSVLYTFTGGSDGAYPNDTLVSTAGGTFYATALAGGIGQHGTVFSLTP